MVLYHFPVEAAVPMHRVTDDGVAQPVQVAPDLVKPAQTGGEIFSECNVLWLS